MLFLLKLLNFSSNIRLMTIWMGQSIIGFRLKTVIHLLTQDLKLSLMMKKWSLKSQLHRIHLLKRSSKAHQSSKANTTKGQKEQKLAQVLKNYEESKSALIRRHLTEEMVGIWGQGASWKSQNSRRKMQRCLAGQSPQHNFCHYFNPFYENTKLINSLDRGQTGEVDQEE